MLTGVLSAILFLRNYRGIAQLVEHWSPKPGVVGSSPATPATKTVDLLVGFLIDIHLKTVYYTAKYERLHRVNSG